MHAALSLISIRFSNWAIGLICALTVLATSSASMASGWGGIVPGSNDYNHPVLYPTPGEACSSVQNSYVPNFGFQVYGLIAVTAWPDSTDPSDGTIHSAMGCKMSAGANGTPTIVVLLGCDGTDKGAQGACVPSDYPKTAEPLCGGSLGTPGSCPTVGDPVSLSSGAKVEMVTDYTSGGAYPIEVKRYYRSMMMPPSGSNDGMGGVWQMDILGRHVEIVYPHYNMIIRREDGARTRFMNTMYQYDPNALGVWKALTIEGQYNNNNELYHYSTPDARDKIVEETLGTYKYTDENDRTDTLALVNGAYIVTQTTWKGGYIRNYTYDGGNHLTGLTDSLGRSVTFTWTGNVVTQVVLPDGTKLQYTFQQQSVGGVSVPGTELLTQVTRRKADNTLIDSTTYEYDRGTTSTPLLTAVKDTNGAVIESTTYDARGRALTAQRAGGADYTSIVYDDVNDKRTVTNALGQVSVYTMVRPAFVFIPIPTVFELSSVARQASATVPAATLTQTYDLNGFLSQRVDFNGKIYNFTNDSAGNETNRVEDAGTGGLARSVTTTWSTTFKLPTQIVAPNLTVDLTYDAAGRLTQRKETDTTIAHSPPSRTWTYTWTTAGLLQSVTGPRTDLTQTTSYTYDTAGNLATVTNALSQVTTILSTNSMGLPTSTKDPNNVITNLTYDPLGRLLTAIVQGPTPATTTFTYDVNGLLTSLTTPAGVTLTYGYNAAHQLTSMTDQASNQMVFTLDALANHLQTQVVNGSSQVLMTNSATFDSLGRLLTSIGAANQTTAYQYDGNSNRTRITDPRNAATQNAFDGLNRVKQVTDALNAVTQIGYDGQNNVTSITDPRLHPTTYTVNGFGFVTQVVSPDSGTTIYTYDLAGNILSRKDARRITVNYTYDALNRIKTRTSPATALNVSYTYDATAGGNYGAGRLTSLTDAAGSASFTYDAYGNLVSENRTISSVQYTTGYGYDLDKNLTQITYPSGLLVSYQRDAQGRVVGITSKLNVTASTVTLASGGQY
ncbi:MULTISPECIES: DUF6531 domain-containing protein, partial [unclassified Mesorhizobium]